MAPLCRILSTLAVAALLALTAAFAAPGPASAHPFGDPQTADLTSTDTGVRVAWAAAQDDVTALALYLGVLGDVRTFVFDNGALVPEESDLADGAELAKAPEFGEYVLGHIAVSAAGTPCVGELLPVTDVTADGATVDFDCGGPVEQADVSMTMLTDLNEAYRTLATGPHQQRNAYSDATPSFSWTFGPPSEAAVETSPGSVRGRSAAVQLGGIGAVVVVAGGAVLLVRRGRTRH